MNIVTQENKTVAWLVAAAIVATIIATTWSSGEASELLPLLVSCMAAISTWGTPTLATLNGYGDLGFRYRYVGRFDV